MIDDIDLLHNFVRSDDVMKTMLGKKAGVCQKKFLMNSGVDRKFIAEAMNFYKYLVQSSGVLPKAGDDVGGGKSVGGDLCKLIINGCIYILFKPSFTE